MGIRTFVNAKEELPAADPRGKEGEKDVGRELWTWN
jgi:hypothetical protein